MNETEKADASLMLELRDALARDEIVPYFQPMVALATGRLAGFEVLARWLHPIRHRVPPSVFIPLAEKAGLIGELTDRVVTSACAAAAEWPNELTLSVNVSPLILHDPSFPGRLEAIVAATGMPFSRLMIEITESAVIGDLDAARDVMCDLKALGARIAQDDFGMGFSSLRQLRALPFDELKVDSSFVRSMTSQRESRKIVAAVVGLGLSLGLTTVAEGVETQQQAEMLAAMGCDLGQGWWFGRPVQAGEATRGVKSGRWNRNEIAPTAHIASEIAQSLEATPSRQRERIQAIYDDAPVALALLDDQFRYVTLNRRLADMHGLPAEAHIGRTVADVCPEKFKIIEPILNRVLAGETVTELRYSLKPADMDGVERDFVGSYAPVRDDTDRVIGITVALIDITDRQEARRIKPALTMLPAISAPHPQLSPRQTDVLRLAAEGRSVKEIARDLRIGIGTVKAHLAHVYTALGARNRVEAISRSGILNGWSREASF